MTEKQDVPAKSAPPAPDSGWLEAAAENHAPTVRTLPSSAYAPITGAERVSRLGFARKRAVHRPWVARVFVKGDGSLASFTWPAQPTTGELVWGGYRSVYDVDLSLRNLTLDITLPSSGDAFVFRTEVDVQWKVEDPEKVVAEGIRDLRKPLVPQLLAELRQASRALAATDVETAEKAVNSAFDSDRFQSRYGISTTVHVRLRMDAQTERNVRLEAEVRAFKKLIENGDIDQFALQLAQNPRNVEPVIQALIAERDTYRKDVLKFINELVESDALDRWQLDDHVRVALQWMETIVKRVLTGDDAARQLPFEPQQNGEAPHLAAADQDGT
ncbi:hypothetical protein [Amycolatopsis silviterrae]|uniref:Band 7 domain-containing protein n=1 Tax=Amycolatopsis silviterrae TaxID=1656914 RepID=A0ABW5HLX0_9PSEU